MLLTDWPVTRVSGGKVRDRGWLSTVGLGITAPGWSRAGRQSFAGDTGSERQAEGLPEKLAAGQGWRSESCVAGISLDEKVLHSLESCTGLKFHHRFQDRTATAVSTSMT